MQSIRKEDVRVERRAKLFAIGSVDLIEDKKIAREILQGSTVRYTGGLDGRQIKRAIPVTKEKLFPEFAAQVGTDFSSNQWTELSKNYWIEFVYHVPCGSFDKEHGIIDGAVEINASYTIMYDEDGRESFHPDVFSDYVVFELMKTDRKVSGNIDDYGHNSNIRFFCVDLSAEKEKLRLITEASSEAVVKYSEMLLDPQAFEEKINYYRSIVATLDEGITSIYSRGMSVDEVKASLLNIVTKKPKEFLELIQDSNLVKKAFIRSCVEAQLITKVGLSYSFNGEHFEDENALIKYLYNPANTVDKENLKLQLQENISIGIV